jgi:hypothetical protein
MISVDSELEAQDIVVLFPKGFPGAIEENPWR